jgi:hypothetical protein
LDLSKSHSLFPLIFPFSQICGLRTFSEFGSDESNKTKSAYSASRIIDLDDETAELAINLEEVEVEDFVNQEVAVEETHSSVHFTPISIDQSDLALAPTSSDVTSNLQATLLKAKRRKLELLRARMESSRREKEETEVYRERHREQTAIESLKTVHLILDTESGPCTALQSAKLSSAQLLLQARMRLLETLSSSQLDPKPKNATDGPWVNGGTPMQACVGTVNI